MIRATMVRMKRFALLAVALGLAACGPKVELDFADTEDGSTSRADDGDGDDGDDGDGSVPPSPSTTMPPTTSPPEPTITAADVTTSVDDGSDDGTGPMVCTYSCTQDSDCTIGGSDIGFFCIDGTCAAGGNFQCMDDYQCVPILSGWSATPCTMGGGECAAFGGACVDLGDGTGGCANVPGPDVPCEAFGFEEVMATSLDDGSEIGVCGDTQGVCNVELGYCYIPCIDDMSCFGLSCEVTTGLCVCTGHEQCAALGVGLDFCDAGACIDTCEAARECQPVFDGGTVTCQ